MSVITPQIYNAFEETSNVKYLRLQFWLNSLTLCLWRTLFELYKKFSLILLNSWGKFDIPSSKTKFRYSLFSDHPSGCVDGTTDALAGYEEIQACKGKWIGHVKRGKSFFLSSRNRHSVWLKIKQVTTHWRRASKHTGLYCTERNRKLYIVLILLIGRHFLTF